MGCARPGGTGSRPSRGCASRSIDVEEIGDNVLTLARQIGTTRHGGVELEQPSAAVWKFRDGKIVRVEFHLDRDLAQASAREPAD